MFAYKSVNVVVGQTTIGTSHVSFPAIIINTDANGTMYATINTALVKTFSDGSAVSVGQPIENVNLTALQADTFKTYDFDTGSEDGTSTVKALMALLYSFCISREAA